MRKPLSLILAVIMLIACSGCFWGWEPDNGGHGDRERGGYGEHDRGEHGGEGSH